MKTNEEVLGVWHSEEFQSRLSGWKADDHFLAGYRLGEKDSEKELGCANTCGIEHGSLILYSYHLKSRLDDKKRIEKLESALGIIRTQAKIAEDSVSACIYSDMQTQKEFRDIVRQADEALKGETK